MIDNELKQYLDEFRERFRQIDARFEQIDGQFAQMRAETAAEFRQFRADIYSKAEETKLHFDSTIDRLQSKFDLVGDGIKNLDEKIDREAASIRVEMRQGFADTHALIRFSHAQRAGRAKR
jgi:hypothetical protein